MAEINPKDDTNNIYIPDSTRRKMQKVPQVLRQENNNQQEYDPMVVSIGPYHHGKQELQLAEDFKIECFKMFKDDIAEQGADPESLYRIVLRGVNHYRNYYIDNSTTQYDNHKFAKMMLLDACFIINYVLTDRKLKNRDATINGLGHLFLPLIQRDLFLLENQIPFELLRMLINMGYGQEKGDKMLCTYFNSTLYGDYNPDGIDSPLKKQPFHLLDAFKLVLVPTTTTPNKLRKISKNCTILLQDNAKFPSQWCKLRWSTPQKPQSAPQMMQSARRKKQSAPRKPQSAPQNHDPLAMSQTALRKPEHLIELHDEEQYNARKWVHSFRSASELKSRGIHFRPSKVNSLMSIKFNPGTFFATLQVPVWFVSMDNKVFFLNMIAYELCPNARTDRVVTAYIEFMKKLIDNPKDVKELREQNILLITSGNDEDVVKVYKELNSYGIDSIEVFQDAKQDIQDHYCSKRKTWLAELFYVYFRTPWNVIALLAATALLILTILQTYFTIHPR